MGREDAQQLRAVRDLIHLNRTCLEVKPRGNRLGRMKDEYVHDFMETENAECQRFKMIRPRLKLTSLGQTIPFPSVPRVLQDDWDNL